MEPEALACLPVEVVEEILQHAWNSTSCADERKTLLATFACADSILHGLLERAATRSVILDVSDYSTDDMDLYADLADRVAAEAGERSRSEGTRSRPEINEYYNLEISEADVLAFRANVFKRSHLRIEGLTGASNQTPRRDSSLPYRPSDDAHRYTWGYVLMKLTNVIPDARAVTLAPSRSSSPWPAAKQILPALLFPTLRSFPSLRSVRLAVFFEVLTFASHSAAPPRVPQVTALRLAHVPMCECAHADWRARRADGHLECCLAATLLECFPGLRDLHLENPVFLKTLCPPAALRTLTIDAPPVRRIEGRQAFSSIIEYNVTAAVKRGFMSALSAAADEGGGIRRKIVVLTGAEQPFGWVSAKATCDEAGIELVQVAEYAEPVVRVDPMLNTFKSSAAGSVPRSLTVLEAAKMTAIY
ncbi:hypothetical protein C8T65DRAFT_118974 [Cerioporus squamosus]|nr:hypothetical protein C8T65DRAFT_118974 [Cerioporus squamosus]